MDHRKQRVFSYGDSLHCASELLSKSDSSVITTPCVNDVLLGRGNVATRHPGNILFRGKVEEFVDRYDKAIQGEKQLVARQIFDWVHGELGGRFLKSSCPQDDQVRWEEVAKDVALAKVSQALRYRRRQNDQVGSEKVGHARALQVASCSEIDRSEKAEQIQAAHLKSHSEIWGIELVQKEGIEFDMTNSSNEIIHESGTTYSSKRTADSDGEVTAAPIALDSDAINLLWQGLVQGVFEPEADEQKKSGVMKKAGPQG